MAVKPVGTEGGVMSPVPLLTVTLTVALVALLPAASFAMARKECAPFVAVVVFQETEYGAAVSSEPKFTPSN